MGVPFEAPPAVHQYWAGVPNQAEIWLLFRLTPIGPTIKVKCEGWGQLANDRAATMQAIYHIKNHRTLWWATYSGWQEIGGSRHGDAPKDFQERYRQHWQNLQP
jgi:hypothetical protein